MIKTTLTALSLVALAATPAFAWDDCNDYDKPPAKQPPVEQPSVPPTPVADVPPGDTPLVAIPPARKAAPTCRDLIRNGAGRKWLVKFGCVKKIKTKTVDCRTLLRNGAGVGWLIEFECLIPSKPKTPAVAG